jgi:membrane associated rhomboid family serine protease
VGLVLITTVVLSLAVAFGERHAGSLYDIVALVPARVLHGQVWRLATWALVEVNPFALLFACLFLWWFGRDLAEEWGSRLFLTVYGGTLLAASVVTCLVAVVDADVREQFYLGRWAVAAGLSVAWGFWFPDRTVRIWFILPVRGVWIAYGTLIVTVFYAVFHGWEGYLPSLTTEGAMLVWMFRGRLTSRFRRAKTALADHRRAAERAAKKRKSASYLRLVESHDDDPAPLPKELEGRVEELFRGKPPERKN